MAQNARWHTPHRSKPLLAASWLYTRLLFIYPSRFRREYAVPMTQLFRDEARQLLQEGEKLAFFLFLVRTLLDLLKTAFIEQLEENFKMTLQLPTLSYHDAVREIGNDAEQLERLFHEASKRGESSAFKQAIDDFYVESPQNLLFAAWFHRLQYAAVRAKSLAIEWSWVVPLAVLNGLIFWWLSDEQQFMVHVKAASGSLIRDFIPAIFLLVAPIATLFVLTYLVVVSRRESKLAAGFGLVPALAVAYVLLAYRMMASGTLQGDYLTLMVFHLPLLGVAAVGAFLIWSHRDARSRFAFMIKTLEVGVMGGLFAIAGGIFTGITFALFGALGIEPPVVVVRLFAAGGGGLIPVVATAVIYNPRVPPADQAFDEGFSKIIALLMRILLPLTLIVLLIYLGFIPFNFREPFENRDVLIIYNGMLFAVILLLVGATPIHLDNVSERLENALRIGIVTVASLALIIGIYALAAILFRTVNGVLTPNRFAFIGWNIINIGLLIYMLYHQARAKADQWLPALFHSYRLGTAVYIVWVLVVTFVTPWLFR